MNKTQKNIILVGFSNIENKSIKVPLIGNNYYLNDMKEAGRHQGYLIIINNKENISLVDFDKKYRNVIKKYYKVWLYNENYKYFKNKWANIELVNRDIFNIDELNFWDEYDLYKENIKKEINFKFTKKRIENIDKLYEYLKNYKNIKTKKICFDLKLNKRMVQRYMNDVNKKYNNIGYDYSNNEWYIIQ